MAELSPVKKRKGEREDAAEEAIKQGGPWCFMME